MVKRVIYPPVWLLLGLIAIFVCNEYFPGPRFTSLAGQLVGGVFIIIGLLLLVLANGLFTRAGTGVIPFRNVSALVTDGIFRYTRNPMYLGMVAVLLGCAITVGASVPLFIPLLFAVYHRDALYSARRSDAAGFVSGAVPGLLSPRQALDLAVKLSKLARSGT